MVVKICECCSGISKEKLQKVMDEDQISVKCIGVCKKFKDRCFGYINKELIYTKDEDEFIKVVKHINK